MLFNGRGRGRLTQSLFQSILRSLQSLRLSLKLRFDLLTMRVRAQQLPLQLLQLGGEVGCDAVEL